MFGLETYQFISFLRQLGLAVAGAASLWGLVFIYISSKKSKDEPSGVVLAWIGLRLRWLVYGGGLLAISSWFVLSSIFPVIAHEGVTLVTEKWQVLQAIKDMTPVYLAFTLLLLISLLFKNFKLWISKKGISWFYLASFVLVSIAISYYTDFRGLPLGERVFHVFHGFHSIFTLGTVLTLDFMFLSSRSSMVLQQYIFPLFPKISKVIWVGLSLDLLSTLLIFPDAVILSPRFFFAQSVVGILIINGVMLSGVITRRILKLLEEGKRETSKRWMLFANIAGTISVTSWTSITFVDFFPNITFSYLELMGIYFSTILIIFVLHEIWEYFDKGEEVVFIKS